MMTNLSDANKSILKRALDEFDASLTRIEAERDHQKAICQRVKDTTGIEPKVFRKAAKIYHKQNRPEVETEFDEVIAVYEAVVGGGSDE
ncbi:MAG: hypothetical protein D6732_21765 [Methanobacteriota archaeon]|nr:MAG: hypothetical protein D6732_21765 [Euryarchaeota archaeon]